jgi:hypothetical protein
MRRSTSCYTCAVMNCLHARLLRKAAQLLGGARPLQAPAQTLARWMAGLEPMPRPVFLKVVDLVIELTSEPAQAPTSLSPRARADAPRSRPG